RLRFRQSPEVAQYEGEAAPAGRGVEMLGTKGWIVRLRPPCPSPGIFGEHIPALRIGGGRKRVGVRWIGTVDRGAYHIFRYLLTGRGMELEVVNKVIEDINTIPRIDVQQSGCGVSPPGGPRPGIGKRFAWNAGMFGVTEVVLVDGVHQGAGNAGREARAPDVS